MSLTFDLPPDVEQQLREGDSDLDASAKEAFLVSLYRDGKLTHKKLSSLLGLNRWQTEDVLAKHHVTEDLPTFGELQFQLETARALRAKDAAP